MSNSRFHSSGKSDIGSTIGFRFHANDEELEELQSDSANHEISDGNLSEIDQKCKVKPGLLLSESLDHSNADDTKSEVIGDIVKDQWNLLGRRSTSVDSNYESPFSNPIETWKKLNILKEKITKTVEEKISEMKIDRNVLSKSGRNKLMLSKENSSVSDSEDTSESSKLSELWKDAEDLNSSSNKATNESSDVGTVSLENPETDTTTSDGSKKSESELRNRKSSIVSEFFKLPDIKIATAKSELQVNSTRESFEEVESGVEAEEILDAETESDSIDLERDIPKIAENSQRPPSRGSNVYTVLNHFGSASPSKTYTAVIIICLALYYYISMSDFLKGFFVCFILMLCYEGAKKSLFPDDLFSLANAKPLVIPDYDSMPPLRVPYQEKATGVWINEYLRENYDPDYYSVTQTVPAYLEIEANILKISRPKGKINRRATYDEPEYKFNFINQRKYNISGCNVFLMPDGLTRKRLYSKKYPIVIFLKPGSFINEKKFKKHDEKENHDEEIEALEWKNKSSLYLFARCDRQKEEWYRRILAATRVVTETSEKIEDLGESSTTVDNFEESLGAIKEASTPFENVIFDEEISRLDEYLRYMVKFVNLSGLENETENPDKIDNEETETEETCSSKNELRWFNAFVNRILFDVFRSPHWQSKIQEKVQRKLNSIRLPYYIEEIEVIELDLGKTGPEFHRVSQPYLDDRGLWFDIDTTFDGFIRLTIQTHLNLIKLQKGLDEDEEMSNVHEKPKKSKRKEKSDHSVNRELQCKASCSSKAISELKLPQQSHDIKLETEANDEPDVLIKEVAQLAEMAVEESLKIKPLKEQNSRECPCTLKKSKSRSPIYDSEVEDSAESSDDEDEEEEDHHQVIQQEEVPLPTLKRYPKNRRSSKRLFRVFENVAQSKYFKSMAQSKYIQKAIAGVSAAKLRLTLEIKSLTGTLAINIPPPPSDRFWYGFRKMPELVFSANPKIGEKAVRFGHIKNYLQKKILHELKKVMVAPNMIDFVLPTSSPSRSSNSMQIEQEDLQDQEETPTE